MLQRDFWDFIKEEKATSIAGVPYTYEMLRRLKFFCMDLPYLKTMTQAGGKMNSAYVKEYVDFAEANNKRFVVMYGQTEASPRMSYLPHDKAVDKYASIGIAIPGGKFSLIDAGGDVIRMPMLRENWYTRGRMSVGDILKNDKIYNWAMKITESFIRAI